MADDPGANAGTLAAPLTVAQTLTATSQTQPSNQTPPATDAVITTVELLEAILLSLPLLQLFAVQRVSKAFRDTIAGSVQLQRRMFLLADATITKPIMNPLFKTHIFRPDPKTLFVSDSHNALSLCNHPGIEKHKIHMRRAEGTPADRSPVLPKSPVQESWRKMLVFQPVPRNYKVLMDWPLERFTFVRIGSTTRPEGWREGTMGEFMEFLRSVVNYKGPVVPPYYQRFPKAATSGR